MRDTVTAGNTDAPRLSGTAGKFERVAFYGQMASGKTYLAKYLEETYGYRRVAFADKLKAIAYELFHVTGKDGNSRLILQQIGGSMRAIDKDVWINHLISTLKWYVDTGRMNAHAPIVVDDLRLVNEAEALKANGFTLIRVDVEETQRVARVSTLYPSMPSEAVLDVSEREYEVIVPDYVIVNNNGVDSVLELDKLIDSKNE